MDLDVQQLFLNTAISYKQMLGKFRPCQPGGEFLEQNLITLLCHEFLKENPTGISYTELPFQNDNNKWNKRIDAYLANEQTGYLVEAKGSLSPQQLFASILQDVARLCSKNLMQSLLMMAQGTPEDDRHYQLPNKLKGLIIANTWSKQAAEQWLVDDNKQFSSLSRQVFSLGEYGTAKRYELFLLAGQLQQDLSGDK